MDEDITQALEKVEIASDDDVFEWSFPQQFDPVAERVVVRHRLRNELDAKIIADLRSVITGQARAVRPDLGSGKGIGWTPTGPT